jgi:hypothetical protein
VLFAAAASLLILFAGTAQATTPTIAPVSGYWWNPSQTGNGFVIEIQNNQLFMAGFLYANSGEATWVATLGPMSSSSSYAGTLFTDSGGQTLTGAYQGPPQSTTTLGPISITFITDTKATIVWPGGTENIQRFDIIPGGSTATQASTNPQTGWWFNANESGRGFGIEVQNGNIWIAGYMYDASGNPTWYLATGTLLDGAYTGQWTQYQGGLTLNGGYKTPTVANAAVGPITAQFSSPSAGTLTLPNGKQIPLTRFVIPGGPSGPTLTAFSPAEGLPATLLTITGTNINPGATLSLTLSDATGYSVNIPLTAASATSITASVPPYINTSNGSFGSGVVNLTLTQSSGGATQNSNTLQGYQIQKLPAATTNGNSTLALIQANLQEANNLQQKIMGTPQATPAVESAIATQIADLQSLATNIQNVVQQGQSFSLGSVGGVNIEVTPANINDVDNLILAQLQSLATPQTLTSSMRAETTTAPGCMSAEAQAYANGVLAGDSLNILEALALTMIEAPYASNACADAAAFTLAYDIFGGAGNIGLGITDAAGNHSDAASLPIAALFATTNANANTAVGLNALLSKALAADVSTVQTAISSVQALSQPAINQLISEAAGDLLTDINDAQSFTNVVAPPSSSSNIPSNVTQGDYTIYLAICSTAGSSQDCIAQYQLTTLNDTNPAALATYLSTLFSDECSQESQIPNISCSASYSSFNGTQFTFTVNITGGTAQLPQTVVITFTLVKTG